MAVLVIADSHLEGQGEDGLALGDVATRLETASAAAAVGEADGQTAPRGTALHAPLDELAHHRALANLIVRLHVRAVVRERRGVEASAGFVAVDVLAGPAASSSV